MYNKIQLIVIALLSILIISCSNNSPKESNENNKKKYLNNWQFQTDVFNIGEKEKWFTTQFDKSEWSKVNVPNAWDTFEDALWGYEGLGWYYTEISKSTLGKNKIIRLNFNRINYYSKIWLNGILVGENVGGYLPFEIDVSDIISRKNTNSIVIRVDNKPRINWLPASKQIEWVQYGGILQPVEIIETDSVYVDDVTINTVYENNNSEINCLVKITNKKKLPSLINLSLSIPLGAGHIEKKINLHCAASSDTSVVIQLNMERAKLWSPETPNLYELNVLLSDSTKIYDSRDLKFGIRNIKTQERNIVLNNKILKIKGVNRYDIFDRRGPILDEQEIRNDLLKIKQMGVNTIRVHYPQTPLTLRLLDEVGLLLIEELPLNWWGQNWWDDEKVFQDTSILKQASITLEKMILRDKNHPCIIAWSLANECKTDTKVGNYVLKRLIKKARSLDSTRLITFTVNDEVGKHKAFEDVDFISCNIYNGNNSAYHIDMLNSMVRIPSENDIRSACNYFPNKPMVVSEFGATGIKNIYGDVLFSEDYQAEYIKYVWKAITNVDECSGGILWSWADYYHRKYFNHTYAPFGPYGVVSVNRKPKKSFEVLLELFNEKSR